MEHKDQSCPCFTHLQLSYICSIEPLLIFDIFSISQTREGARPARVKKLTEKGKDWAHSLNKNDLATFRIPHSPQSPNSMLLQMPSTSSSSSGGGGEPSTSVDNGAGETDEAKLWSHVPVASSQQQAQTPPSRPVQHSAAAQE